MTPGLLSPGSWRARGARRRASGVASALLIPVARWATCLLVMLGMLYVLGLAEVVPDAR